MVRISSVIRSRPRATMAAGVSARANRRAVALFTDTSVA